MKTNKFYVPLIVLLAFVSLGLGYYVATLFASVSVNAPSEKLESFKDHSYSSSPILYFVRDGKLYERDSNGKVRVVVNETPGELVKDFSIIKKDSGTKIVYETARRRVNSDSYMNSHIKILSQSANNTIVVDENVPERKPLPDDFPEDSNDLGIYSLSRDKSKLAFNIGMAFYIYSIDNNIFDDVITLSKSVSASEEEFCKHLSVDSNAWVSDSLMLVTNDCYEGSMLSLFDLSTQKIVKTLGFVYIGKNSNLFNLYSDKNVGKVSYVYDNRYNVESVKIMVVDVASGKEKVLTSHVDIARRLVFDPKTEFIYYLAKQSKNSSMELWRIKLDGSSNEKLTNEGVTLRNKGLLKIDLDTRTLTYVDASPSFPMDSYPYDIPVIKNTNLVIYDLDTGKLGVVKNASIGQLVK